MDQPTRFGNFDLLTRIATGGLTETFLARRRGDDEPGGEFVVKRFLPFVIDDTYLLDLCRKQAKQAQRLGHQGLARVFHFGDTPSTGAYVAAEYAWGENLRLVAERGMTAGRFLPIPHAAEVALQIADALCAVHEQKDHTGIALNLVHRDLSPDNLVLGFDGRVKLLDLGLGLADFRSQPAHRLSPYRKKLGYMSPEQIEGGPIDARSDIFSLGALLYEFTTRKRLFRASDDDSLMDLVAAAEVKAPSRSLPSYPSGLERIVMTALAKDPDDRFQNAEEMAEALRRFNETDPDSSNHHISTEGDTGLSDYMRSLFGDRMERLEPLLGVDYEGPQAHAGVMAGDAPAEEPDAPEAPEAPEETADTGGSTSDPAPDTVSSNPPAPSDAPGPSEAPVEPVDLTAAARAETTAPVTAVAHTLRKGHLDEFEKTARRSTQATAFIAFIIVAMLVGGLYWYNKNYHWPWEGISDDRVVLPDQPPPDPREPPETIDVALSSRPTGARISRNGIMATGVTPSNVPLVPDAINTIVFYLDGHETLVTEIDMGDVAPPGGLAATLIPIEQPADWVPPTPTTDDPNPVTEWQPPIGIVQVTADPPNVGISLNGVETCDTPCRLEVPAGQEQHISGRAFGRYDTASVTVAPVYVDETDLRYLHLTLTPDNGLDQIYTYFQLDSFPPGVLIDVNGEPVGRTPVGFAREIDGFYRVAIQADGYDRWARSFYPSIGRFELRPVLQRVYRAPSMISVYVDAPDMPDTVIYLGRAGGGGSNEMGRDRLEQHELPGGEYELLLSYTPPRGSGERRRSTALSLSVPPGQQIVERYAWTGDAFVVTERTEAPYEP